MTLDPIATACIQTLESVLEPRSAIYVCGALETGRSYYESLAAGRDVDLVELRAENQARLTDFARSLRARLDVPIIDPGILRVASWSRDMYGPFFLRVVDMYAFEAWFIEGWEFSRGATSEYVHCSKAGIPCRDASGDPLPVAQAVELLQGATTRLSEFNLDASKFESRIATLANLQATTRG
jgi:hypothetical protein